MVLDNISYFNILGLPLLYWIGILAMIGLLATAIVTHLIKKGKATLKQHTNIALVSIMLALIHVLLAILVRF